MDPSFHPQTSSGGRVFRGACVVLAAVALAQGVAVAMAWKERPAPVVLTAPGPSATDAVPAIDPFQPGSTGLDDPHPELAKPAGKGTAVQVLARPLVAGPSPLDLPITDEACLGHLDEGIYLRDRGDMVGAVRELRLALALAPEHPKLLYHLATALDGMSQERKAAVHWRQLRLLGPEAGNYYQLAVGRLSEGGNLPSPDEVAATAVAEEEKEGRFLVAGVKVERVPTAVEGEVLLIEGQIERKQSEPADVAKVDMKLHLFDEVNGQRIDRTTALQPLIEWLDVPVDWSEGSERFRFEYRQAPFSPDELLKLGQRKYYGYAIEFRYDDGKLQDIAGEPAFLADMALEIPESSASPAIPFGGEGFDPSVPAGLPDQPDAVLFPGDRMDR